MPDRADSDLYGARPGRDRLPTPPTTAPHGLALTRIERPVRWIAGLSVMFELTPFCSGTAKYGGLAAVYGATRSTALSVAYIASITFVIEFSAALGMVHLLRVHAAHGLRVFRLMDRSIGRLMPAARRISPLTKLLVLNLLGSASLVYVMARECHDGPPRHGRRLALGASLLVSLSCAIQGYCIALGVGNPENPRIVIPAAAVLIGIAATARWIRHRLRRASVAPA